MSHRQQPSAAKRPKLSLKTSDTPRACGRSSTALSFASSIVGATGGLICHTPTSATASPTTARNTFSNAYAIPGTPVPTSATPAVASPLPRQATSRPHSPLTTRKPSFLPYQQPLHLRSILRNSPLPIPHRRRMTSTSSPLFPRAKRVRYADPLAREIRTELFVKSHYELVIASGGKEEEEEGDVEARTPVRRRGRRREWIWTLGDVVGVGAGARVGPVGAVKRGREEDEDEDGATYLDSDSGDSSDSNLSNPAPQPSETHPNKRRKLHFSLPHERKPPPAAATAPRGREEGFR